MILLATLATALFIAIILSIIFWRLACSDPVMHIRFSALTSLYEMNPERWHLEKDEILCAETGVYRTIALNYPDYIQYLFWLRKMRKSKERAEKMRESARFVQVWEKDIERYRKDKEV